MKSRLQALWINIRDTTMWLTLALWLCVLPLVLWLVVPFFGWRGGLAGAIATFVVALAACYAICIFKWSPARRT